MKQFFAKYLPVEGEIKEGDITQFWGFEYGRILKFNSNIKEEDVQLERLTGNKIGQIEWEIPSIRKPFKLFLCSRDIQVGDTIKSIQDDRTILVDRIEKNKHNFYYDKNNVWFSDLDAYKVIGEISPNAVWVKEGDEFDENQIKPVDMFNSNKEGLLYIGYERLADDESVMLYWCSNYEYNTIDKDYDYCIDHCWRMIEGEDGQKITAYKIKCPCCGDFK